MRIHDSLRAVAPALRSRLVGNPETSFRLDAMRTAGVILVDLAMILVGASLLWLYPTGESLASVSPLGALLFILATAGFLFVRNRLHLSPAADGGGRPEPRRPLLAVEVGRTLILVAAALASLGWGSYFAQWVAAYATVAAATLAAISLISSIAVGSRGMRLAGGTVTFVGSLIGIVLTSGVHGFDPHIFGTVAVLLLAALFLSRIISFWFEVTVNPRATADRTAS